MAKDVSKLKIVNDNTEYLFKDLLARNNISSLLGSGILTSLTLNTFFAAPSNKDGVPLFRKITASDLPVLNQDTTGIASYAKYLRGRQSDGTYYGSLASNNIIAEWNTKSDNRWYLKAVETYECRVDYSTTSEKVKGTLKFGSKSFNGSLDVVLLGSDLGSVDLTSELTITGLKTFSGETYLDSLNANTGLISGNLRVVNGIFGNLTGNVTGNLSGNASTATKLQTARTLTIGNAEKSFDGSSNVSWTLSEIGAASSGHTHSYLPLSGGTVTGQLYLTGLEEGTSDVTDNTELLTSYASNNGFNDSNAKGTVYRRDAIKVYNYIKNKLDLVYSAIDHTHSYLPLSGGTMIGQIVGNDKGGGWIYGRHNAALYQKRNNENDWHPVVGFKTKTGSWEFGSVGDNDLASFSWGSDSDFNSGNNSTTVVNLRNIGGTIALTSDIPTSLPANGGNSDTVDGHHAGYYNNAIALLCPWPSSTTMKNEGFMPLEYGTPNYGYPDEIYLLSICKWAIATYPNLGSITLIGSISPNASGTCILNLYSSSGKDSSTLLPRYCRGQYLTLKGLLYQFGTNEYTWSYGLISAGYATNAGSVDWNGVTNKPNFVNSFETKTGDITIRGGQTSNGSVNLVMSNNELLASIVGLGSNAYTSTAYLPLTGGTLNSGADIVWRDRGAWGDSSATYPYSYGGLYWSGTSDSIKIYGKEELSDLLNLWITFGDDKGHAIKIDDNGNVYTVYHTGNLSPMTTSHPANGITADNIKNWNTVYNWYSIAADNDGVNDAINTWKEVEAFLTGVTDLQTLTGLLSTRVAKSGDWMDYGSTISFKGVGGSTNVYGKIGYMPTTPNGFIMHCVNTYQNSGAFYLTSNGCDSANNHGGIAIDNEGVTVFGAGDAGSNFTGIFRVLNEDNVGDGPLFLVTKSSGASVKYSFTAGTSISAGTTITAATSVTSTAGDFYVGGTSGSRCHIKMDTTNKCIKFIFD